MIHASPVRSTLNYTRDSGTTPALYFYSPEPGTVFRGPGDDPREVSITPSWDRVEQLSLDREGFELHPCDIAFTRFDDAAAVQAELFPEVERFVRERVGARRVHVFDYNVRSPTPGPHSHSLHPVRFVHSDYTVASGPQRVRQLLPDEADALLARRVAFFNLWKPTRRRVEQTPLAVCDVRAVAPAEGVRVELRYPERTGEIYAFQYSEAHRWCYFPNMEVNQALLLKCYDSETDGRARFAPHSAFDDPTSPPDAPLRESIELRTVAFF